MVAWAFDQCTHNWLVTAGLIVAYVVPYALWRRRNRFDWDRKK